MTDHQADLPDKFILGDSWGLGWIRFGWDGERLIGHDGNTLGQAAFLRILPPEQGRRGRAAHQRRQHPRPLRGPLPRDLRRARRRARCRTPFAPPAEPVEVDITPYVGTYERASVRMEVFAGDDGPRLRTTVLGPLAELVPDPVDEYPLVPVGPGAVRAQARPSAETWAPVTFYELPTGERYVHFGVRATPRVDCDDHGPRRRAASPTCASWSSASRRRPTWRRSPGPPTWSPASAPPGSASSPSGSSSTAAPTCAGASAPARPGCCCVGHHDTVWPIGSLATHPFVDRRTASLRGPGCFDMKTGRGDGLPRAGRARPTPTA